MQPFRYRGYVYDEETGLYYLRSRYYSAVCSRFINMDAFFSAHAFTASLFSYCANNPCVRSDDFGTDWFESIKGKAAALWNGMVETVGSAVSPIIDYGLEIYNETILPAFEYAKRNNRKWKQLCFEAAGEIEDVVSSFFNAIFDTIGGFRTMGEWFETTVGSFALMSSKYFVERCSYIAAERGVAKGIGMLFGASVSIPWWITLIGLSHDIGAQIDGKHAIVEQSEIPRTLIDSAGGVIVESIIPDENAQFIVNIILTMTQE